MSRNRTAVAAAAAVGLLLTGTTVAVEVAAVGTADASGSVQTKRFVAHDIAGNFAMDDLAAPQDQNPGLGDLLAFTQRLTRGGHTVGRVSNVAVGVDQQRRLFQSNGTMKLAHGTIEFGGLVPQASRFTLAVTGGTGRFEGATGTLHFGMKGNRQILTLTLRR